MNFHELCRAEHPLILPGAFDAMSARLIQRAGFKAYFTGGFPTIGARWDCPTSAWSRSVRFRRP